MLGTRWSLTVNGETVPGSTAYSDRQPRELLALVGSHGWVEIAVNGGSAQARLNIGWGDAVCIVVETVATDLA